MFQNFEPVSDKSFAARHLPLLRAKMSADGLDGFIVPHDDEYQNEYIPAYAERLLWATGFSGSAGDALILQNDAILFTDGRYTLQVREQTDADFFDYVDTGEESLPEWLASRAPKGAVIGFDPTLHTLAGREKLEAAAKARGFELRAVARNPVDEAWTDQPPAPKTPARPHDQRFAGQSADDKRGEIAKSLREKEIDAALIASPASIAWAFNLRGGDVARTPLPLARALVRADGGATLFIDPDKIDNETADALGPEVARQPETSFCEALAGLAGQRIAVDPNLTPAAFAATLEEAGARIVRAPDPCLIPRATKNATELEGARAAHVADGAAVTRFLHWLATEAQSGEVDEIGAAQRLEAFRAEHHDLRDLSFDTISGAGANGAICHYRVSSETNARLEKGSLYLVDSGGQYPAGTTDVTRTVPIGQPTEEMRDRYTRVLKGHIALATLRFPKGTTGHQIDAIARRPLWDAGLDYDHGTGHGVGSFLGVHEGPQRIAKAVNAQPLLPGMILSNEPGYYRAGAYGVRIENLVIVTAPRPVDGGEREMMAFETITMAPLSRALINPEILDADEVAWIDAYHQRVLAALTAQLPDDVLSWARAETAPLA